MFAHGSKAWHCQPCQTLCQRFHVYGVHASLFFDSRRSNPDETFGEMSSSGYSGRAAAGADRCCQICIQGTARATLSWKLAGSFAESRGPSSLRATSSHAAEGYKTSWKIQTRTQDPNHVGKLREQYLAWTRRWVNMTRKMCCLEKPDAA